MESARISEELNAGLSFISYHVKVLRDFELIEQTKTEPRRGAVEHFYRALVRPQLPAGMAKDMPKSAQKIVGNSILLRVDEDVWASLESEQFFARDDWHTSWTPAELCFSGAYTGGVRCGEVVGIRKQLYNEGSRPAGSIQIAARNVAGDSGSPVWDPKTGAAVGILRARQGGYTWVQPLLNTPNNHGDVYVGALQAAKMYDLHIMTGS